MAIHIQEIRKRAATYSIKDGFPADYAGRRNFIATSSLAQCFEFGELSKWLPSGEYTVDFPLVFPAPVCWYEYTISNEPGAFLVDSRSKRYLLLEMFPISRDVRFGWITKFDYETHELTNSMTVDEEDIELCTQWCGTALEMTKLINSKDVILSDRIPIPRERSISSRLRNAPKFTYRTLKVKPERVVALQSNSVRSYDDGEPAYSQRYHFRIGHWRHLANGSKIAVRGYWAGNIALGVVEKDYDCRELIGRDLFGNDGKMRWTKPKVTQDLFTRIEEFTDG